MLSKFKVGDVVVVIAVSDYPSSFPIGMAFSIAHVNIYDSNLVYKNNNGAYIQTKHLEFALIYNTPLYQALT